MARPEIEIIGLKEVVRAFKQVEGATADLKLANKTAAQYVAERAASRVPVRTGKLRSSIRAAGQARGGLVRMGSGRLPYAGPVEFGGYPGSRPYVKEGRYLFPTAKEAKAEIAAIYSADLERLIHQYF